MEKDFFEEQMQPKKSFQDRKGVVILSVAAGSQGKKAPPIQKGLKI